VFIGRVRPVQDSPYHEIINKPANYKTECNCGCRQQELWHLHARAPPAAITDLCLGRSQISTLHGRAASHTSQATLILRRIESQATLSAMSRGLGITQRQVLTQLRRQRSALRPELWFPLLLLMPKEKRACRSIAVSWRRAAHGLAERRLIQSRYVVLRDVDGVSDHSYSRDFGARRMVCVRLPMEPISLTRSSEVERRVLDAARLMRSTHQATRWADPNASPSDGLWHFNAAAAASLYAARFVAEYYEPLSRGALPDGSIESAALVISERGEHMARQIPAEYHLARQILQNSARSKENHVRQA
jgi:hypothetical protein